jgi:hypothetical protein
MHMLRASHARDARTNYGRLATVRPNAIPHALRYASGKSFVWVPSYKTTHPLGQVNQIQVDLVEILDKSREVVYYSWRNYVLTIDLSESRTDLD